MRKHSNWDSASVFSLSVTLPFLILVCKLVKHCTTSIYLLGICHDNQHRLSVLHYPFDFTKLFNFPVNLTMIKDNMITQTGYFRLWRYCLSAESRSSISYIHLFHQIKFMNYLITYVEQMNSTRQRKLEICEQFFTVQCPSWNWPENIVIFQ